MPHKNKKGGKPGQEKQNKAPQTPGHTNPSRFIELGLPENETKRYQDALQNGSTLLALTLENAEDLEKAKKICEKAGANNVCTCAEKAGSKR